MANSNKVRWGILGATARIAQDAVIPALCDSEQGELVAVASRSLVSAQSVAGECGNEVKAYGDYDSLLADPDVEAVYIPLPNNLHLGWAVEAMNNGKHVLCEKPLALNAAEAAEMAETADVNGVVLSEAFMYHYHPLQAEVAKVVADGQIGQVQLVRASFSFQQTQAEDYRRDPGMGGGALLDVGCYCVHIARQAFGREPTAVTAKSVIHPDTGIDTTTTALMEFDGGGMALIDCSFSLAFRASYELVGTGGAICVNKFFVGPDAPGEFILTRGHDETRRVPAANSYARELDAFARKVRGEGSFLLPAADAVGNMAALDAIALSARTGSKALMGE